MSDLDTDKDGAINIHEFRILRDTQDIDVLEEFVNLDENEDGLITPNEIDDKYTKWRFSSCSLIQFDLPILLAIFLYLLYLCTQFGQDVNNNTS